MIDPSAETLISLAKAAREMPGGPVHVSTVHRWRLKGVRGVKLDTIMRGGVRHTSHEAIERFFSSITAAANGEPSPTRTPSQRMRAIREAERELEAAGL